MTDAIVRLPIQVENTVVQENHTALVIVTNTSEGSIKYEVRTQGIPVHIYGCYDGNCAVSKYKEAVAETGRGL